MSVSRESADRGRGGGEGDGDKSEDGSARGDHPARIGWRPSRIACVALLLGLAVTAGLALTAHILYDHNEHRLLKLRARELALVLAATAPTVQTPLASAAELANATAGDTRKFRAFIAPDVGAGRSFSSVSLWSLHGARARPLAVVGATPGLASKPGGARLLRMLARRPGALNLTSMLAAARPAIGFEYNASTAGHGYAVYAENPLPANRRSSLESNNAFSDLDYVLYLGRSHRTSDLLVTSEKTLPLRGLQAAETVPFGSGVFTLVVAPRVTLSGAFFESLPWIVAGAGVLLTLAAAAATERLARGRERAERLARQLDHVAAENEAMYEEQRSISQTLQHALLPDTLPQVRGLSVSALYVPAPSGGDVGGDWYDVVVLDERHVLLVIGDVSGHGLQAATTMALLRHAVLAYVAVDARPEVVLTKLSAFVNGRAHEYFATVLCAMADVEEHTLVVASAGHLPPLLLDGAGGEFVSVQPGPPIGFPSPAGYRETALHVPSGATLVAFTDGLVERRGEVLDVGLQRLRDLAISEQHQGAELLGELAHGLSSQDHRDDTALVSIQWQN